MQDERIIAQTRRWIERVVVELNLCPFARRELERDGLRFAVVHVEGEDELLQALERELRHLVHEPTIETTLLIHPAALLDFRDYNQFLDRCDQQLRELDLEGVLQIASFHPQYQFAGTQPDAAENYSNRSPYPMLHLLREESLSRAVDAHPNAEAIPAQNIATLERLGARELQRLWEHCRDS